MPAGAANCVVTVAETGLATPVNVYGGRAAAYRGRRDGSVVNGDRGGGRVAPAVQDALPRAIGVALDVTVVDGNGVTDAAALGTGVTVLVVLPLQPARAAKSPSVPRATPGTGKFKRLMSKGSSKKV